MRVDQSEEEALWQEWTNALEAETCTLRQPNEKEEKLAWRGNIKLQSAQVHTILMHIILLFSRLGQNFLLLPSVFVILVVKLPPQEGLVM